MATVEIGDMHIIGRGYRHAGRRRRAVRVCCRPCHRKIDTLVNAPSEVSIEVQPALNAAERITRGARCDIYRHRSRRFPCSRCGASYVVAYRRLAAAYESAVADGSRTIRLPLAGRP